MKVLLVDDSTTIRAMLKRALLSIQAMDICEATNGVEALAEIGRRRFDLVILDVNMPVMDGLEALEAIRASQAYRALPVVVLTSEKHEAMVRRLVEMGITDYLSKPLSPDTLSVRLTHIVERLILAPSTTPVEQAENDKDRVLVVEHDPDRRHFLQNVLQGHFSIIDVDSGASALQWCLGPGAAGTDIVFVGEEIGLPPPQFFIKKLKTVPAMDKARIIFCRPKAGGVDATINDLVEQVVDWSYVPEVFLATFERAATGTSTPIVNMPAFRASLERDAVCATEQLFGLMLSSEVALVAPGSAPAAAWNGVGVHARIDLTAAGTPPFTVVFRAGQQSAAAITAQLLGATPEDVVDADVSATAAEFANIIVGRVRNRIVEAGVLMKMQLPSTWTGATAEGFNSADVSTLTFNSTNPLASFDLLLSVGELPA